MLVDHKPLPIKFSQNFLEILKCPPSELVFSVLHASWWLSRFKSSREHAVPRKHVFKILLKFWKFASEFDVLNLNVLTRCFLVTGSNDKSTSFSNMAIFFIFFSVLSTVVYRTIKKMRPTSPILTTQTSRILWSPRHTSPATIIHPINLWLI